MLGSSLERCVFVMRPPEHGRTLCACPAQTAALSTRGFTPARRRGLHLPRIVTMSSTI